MIAIEPRRVRAILDGDRPRVGRRQPGRRRRAPHRPDAEAETVHVGVLVERALDLAHPRLHRHAIVVEKRDERGARDTDAGIACVRDAGSRIADVAERCGGPARDRAIDDRARLRARIVVRDNHFIADAAGLLPHQRIDHQFEIPGAVVRGNDDREIGCHGVPRHSGARSGSGGSRRNRSPVRPTSPRAARAPGAS